MAATKTTDEVLGNVGQDRATESSSTNVAESPDEPDWPVWVCKRFIPLYDAVALFARLDPKRFGVDFQIEENECRPKLVQLRKLREVAFNHAGDSLPARDSDDSYAPRSDLHVDLPVFAEWAADMEAKFPLWENLPAELRQLVQPKLPPRKDTELRTRERDTLLKIIIALAEYQKIDVDEPYKAATVIEPLTIQAGLRVAERTIGDFLAKARRLTENRQRPPGG